MTLQSNVNVTLAYKAEATFGVAPTGASGGQLIRRVSSSLALTKDAIASNEVRADQQIADVRHGTRRVAGGIEAELSTETFDDWLEALLRGTWAAGTSLSQTDLTSVAASASASTFTFAGGNPLTMGLKVGDIVRFGGLAATANNAKNFRITGFSGASSRVMAVTPAPVNIASAEITFTVAVQGKKLLNGTEKRSFAVEQRMIDIDLSELFTGVRVGAGAFNLQPGAMATVSFDLQGKDGQVLEGSASPYFAAPAAQTNTGVLAGVSGAIRLAGVEQAIITALNFSVNVGLNSTPVVGSVVVPDIFYGRTVVTGSVSAYIEDASLIDVFLNEEEVDLVTVLEAAGTDPKSFVAFSFQRVKLNGVQKTIGPEGGVIATFPFQALLKTGGATTAYDQSTMVVQRSNA